MKGISCVDTDSRLRWIEPLPGNERLMGTDVRSTDARAPRRWMPPRKPTRSSLRRRSTPSGGGGPLASARVHCDGRPGGYIVGSFSLPDVLATLEPLNPSHELAFVVLDRGREIYRSSDPRSLLRPGLGIEAPLRILDQPLTVGIVPSVAFIAAGR